jgi:two-component system phosphate regulon response regulator PhoB
MIANVRGLQVMVVDDGDDFRQVLCEMLGDEGYRPIPARHAENAWTLLAAGLRPAAIILDLTLPGMSGQEFLKRLRAVSWGEVIPVLLLSGWERLERFGSDADRVLSKRSEPTTIMRAVDRLIMFGRSSSAELSSVRPRVSKNADRA